MKTHTKSIAAAVVLALTAASAHAALSPPAFGTAAPPAGTLVLAIWDPNNTAFSEVVNLNYTFAQMQGNLNPSSPTSPYVVTSAPIGSGQVLQLNFGDISGFSDSLFPSADVSSLQYSVVASSQGVGIDTTSSTGIPTTSFAGSTTFATHVSSLLSAWTTAAPSSGFIENTSAGATTAAAQAGGVDLGVWGVTGQSFLGTVNTALNFYNIAISGHTVTNTAIGGYFYVNSSNGDVTYNVPYVSAVPLPAAVWLFGSGLLGIAGIGRRRKLSA